MAVLENENYEIYADCHCGCDNGLRIRIEKDDIENYCFCNIYIRKFLYYAEFFYYTD